MGRAPCCEKMGLKKGPWTKEEDEILMSYINQSGHGNWRALPKLAGLLRCGKSCRLRWMNYLRPDIKRGNFTEEEEHTIIRLHEELGNRWSVIAARLPGRTDNEIKNVWHTHLKKRLNKNCHPTIDESKFDKNSEPSSPLHSSSKMSSSNTITTVTATTDAGVSDLQEMDESFWSEVFSADDSSFDRTTDKKLEPSSPQHSTSEMSSSNAAAVTQLSELDDSFWSEVFSVEDSSVTSDISAMNSVQIPLNLIETSHNYYSIKENSMDFWYDLFTRSGELYEMPEF